MEIIFVEGNGRKVDCKDIPTFPDMEIKLGDKVLKVKPDEYIRVKPKLDEDDECTSLLYGMDDPEGLWLLGDPLLRQYYTEYNMKADEESVTFYELK